MTELRFYLDENVPLEDFLCLVVGDAGGAMPARPKAVRPEAGQAGESYESLRVPFNPLLMWRGPCHTVITRNVRVKVADGTQALLVTYLPVEALDWNETNRSLHKVLDRMPSCRVPQS